MSSRSRKKIPARYISNKKSVLTVNYNNKVFLSHSDKDRKIASELKSKLAKRGLSVFLAHEDIEAGADWKAKLYEEIQNSRVFIMLITKNYHSSNYTEQETGIAINCKKTILPICIEGTLPHGFAADIHATHCSLSFEDSVIENIVKTCKVKTIAKNASDLDKLVLELENSNSYTESETVAIQLKKYDDFSESQLIRLAVLSRDNLRVRYSYVADAIINEIIGDNLDKANHFLRDWLERFHDPSHPSLN